MITNHSTRVPASLPPVGLLADLYLNDALLRTAYSALPDAPVQPYVERRRPLRRILAALPSVRFLPPSRPIIVRHAQCSPS